MGAEKDTGETYPIDIVIPWVDGNDPAWQAEREQYTPEMTSSVHEYNYQDWNLLKYWFRGIEKNAPWVRYVFFVTWGHTPEWLNLDNPKLKIIRHSDYIPQEYLPTFSSHPIELNVHRIPELAEHFIYFNDDMFLIHPVKKSDFFVDGHPCDCAIQNPVVPENNNCIAHLQLTTVAVINQNFKKRKVISENRGKWFNFKYGKLLPLNFLFLPWNRFPGLLEQHCASSLLKSTFNQVWDAEHDLLHQTCLHKFRDFKLDVNQWIMKEWQIALGNFKPRRVNFCKLASVFDEQSAIKVKNTLLRTKSKSICINDHVEPDDLEKTAKVFIEYFELLFPEKSSFER